MILKMTGSPRTPKLAYTIDEAAEMLSLSRAHLYRLLDLREIGSIYIGKSRRITQLQLAEFVASCEFRNQCLR